MSRPLVISIVGRAGSGKTTLVEGLIIELKSRGYRVGTVKHHVHPGIDIDQEGKDSWRHGQAGSDHIVISAPDRIASIRKVTNEWPLIEVVKLFNDVDIVVTDGYRREAENRVEIVRAVVSSTPICSSDELSALVTDCQIEIPCPVFRLDDPLGLVDWIEETYLSLVNDD